jgi:hypothetical protein
MGLQRALRWGPRLLAGMICLWILVLALYVATREATLGEMLVVELVAILAGAFALWRIRSMARRIRR